MARLSAAGLGLLSIVQLVFYADEMLSIRKLPALRAPGSFGETLTNESGLFRVMAPRSSLSLHEAQAASLPLLQGYEPVPLARYSKFMTALTGKVDAASVIVADSSPHIEQLREHLLDLANVRFIAQHTARSKGIPDSFHWRPMEQASPQSPSRVRRGGDPLDSESPAESEVLFENADAVPRAFVLGRTRVLDRNEDVVLALAELKPREELLMMAEYLPPGPRAVFGAADVVEYSPNRIVIDVELPGTGYLVLTDSWYPGWMATDNGKQTSVIPGDVAFRAIPLGPGKHRVEYRYWPVGLSGAAALSAVAWLSCAAILVGSRLGFPFRNSLVAFRRR